ncbi:MAG: aminoacyl-tRNA hydrolase [Balneolaceae bacterium]|nr:aminoacyl-tRNA hydrolase [Balneolaceae bacterium]
MILIVGLGNPGNKYTGTRHNVGFEVVDQIAGDLSAAFSPGKGPFYTAKARYRNHRVVLVKPTTYMNRSGDAVQQALHWFKTAPGECLVCYDDLDLPIGTIRLRPQGSAGGHNGVRDIIRTLGTDRFPRLRIGIGSDFPHENQVSYVLSKFSTDQRDIIDEAVKTAAEAALCVVTEGIDEAMNRFN